MTNSLKGMTLAIAAFVTLIFGMSTEAHQAPAPQVASAPAPVRLTTNIYHEGYAPLVECYEDEDCWIGSGADGRDWADITWDMMDHNWDTAGAGCYDLELGSGQGTLTRCEDGTEALTAP